MATFSVTKMSADASGAPRIVPVPLEAFGDTWSGKPKQPVEIGLKRISATDIEQARQDAARQAIGFYEGRDGECIDEIARDEAYNDALMRFAVARATCQPQNPTQPYFELAEDTIRNALTLEGVRLLWDELIVLHRSTGVNQAPIEADEVNELAAILARPGSIERLPEGVRGEIRRLLAYCLDQLAAANPVAPDEEDDDAEVTYVARAAS